MGKKGKETKKKTLEVVTPLVAVEEPVAVDPEVLPLAEEEVVEEEVAVGPEAPLKEETLEAQMIQIRIQSQTLPTIQGGGGPAQTEGLGSVL